MKKKQAAYPSKVTMNLAMKEKSQFAPGKLIPLLLLLFVLAGLFSKFAVADRLAKVDRAQAELNTLQQLKANLETAAEGYEELSEKYARYSIGWMTEDEQAAVTRLEMLSLVEKELMPGSRVRRVSAGGNILSVELSGITLEDTSRFVQNLYQRPDVTNVAVYTASTKDEPGTQATVSMVITMTRIPKGGDQP